MKRKFFLGTCAAFFCSGILLAAFLHITLLFLLGSFFFLGGIFLQKKNSLFQKTVISFLWTLFFALGCWHTSNAPLYPDRNNVGIYATTEGIDVEIKGYVRAFPDKRYRKENWSIEAEKILQGTQWKNTSGRVLITVRKGSKLAFGTRVQLRGTLKSPFISEDFSYRGYLARQKIFSVMKYPQIKIYTNSVFHPLFSPMYVLRTWFDGQIQKYIPPPENGFALGILVGDRAEISEKTVNDFQKTGLSHLLALSGYNITILAIAVFFLFSWLPKRIRIVLTISFLAAFVVFVGGGESVIRAAIMGGIGLLAVHSGRKSDGLYVLLLASAIMLTFSPLIAAYGPSFQLSFFGVLGIVLFSKHLNNFFEQKGIKSRFWREILVATLAAQIGVLPLISFLFGNISIISPIANLIIAPLVPLSMLISFLSAIFGAIWNPLGYIFGFLSYNLIAVQLWAIDFLAHIPFASVPFEIGKRGFFVLLFSVASFWIFLEKKR